MTMTPLTVGISGLDEAYPLEAVLGSLPMSCRTAGRDERADVVLIGGPDWAARATAAVDGGAHGLLLADPWPIDAASLREVADLACPVVVDFGRRHNPAVDHVRDAVAQHRTPHALFEVRTTTTPGLGLVPASLAALDVLTAVAGPLVALEVLRDDAHHLALSGRLTDDAVVVITVAVTRARPRRTSLTVAGKRGRVRLELPDPVTAAPGTAAVTEAGGHRVFPVGAESAHRVAMRRLTAAVLGHAAPPDDLARLRDTAQMLNGAVERDRATGSARPLERARGGP
ncbi:hypothetical protein [Georgenia deserti]|uniref:Gfo/Idh/MocA-like oxidoreductase N-terminal domain-containing protein n=1 Tax=Georgenia deserti TaxID=2093781 RepID=A0ABW4LC39_9MICO